MDSSALRQQSSQCRRWCGLLPTRPALLDDSSIAGPLAVAGTTKRRRGAGVPDRSTRICRRSYRGREPIGQLWVSGTYRSPWPVVMSGLPYVVEVSGLVRSARWL